MGKNNPVPAEASRPADARSDPRGARAGQPDADLHNRGCDQAGTVPIGDGNKAGGNAEEEANEQIAALEETIIRLILKIADLKCFVQALELKFAVLTRTNEAQARQITSTRQDLDTLVSSPERGER